MQRRRSAHTASLTRSLGRLLCDCLPMCNGLLRSARRPAPRDIRARTREVKSDGAHEGIVLSPFTLPTNQRDSEESAVALHTLGPMDNHDVYCGSQPLWPITDILGSIQLLAPTTSSLQLAPLLWSTDH